MVSGTIKSLQQNNRKLFLHSSSLNLGSQNTSKKRDSHIKKDTTTKQPTNNETTPSRQETLGKKHKKIDQLNLDF
jgi:hypothetical protein